MRKEDRVSAEGASCREILSGERLVIVTVLTLKGGSGRHGRKGKPQICPREVIVLPPLTLQKQIPVQAAAPNPVLKEQDTHTAHEPRNRANLQRMLARSSHHGWH